MTNAPSNARSKPGQDQAHRLKAHGHDQRAAAPTADCDYRGRHGSPATPLPPGPAGRQLPTMPPLRETRVGKTLRSGQGGTIKLQRRFGESLLQVRYRYDWTGLFRYTTVELLVDVSPVTRTTSLDTLFTVRLSPTESTLLQEARRHGARWHQDLLCWTLPGRAIQALDLAHRAESTTQRHHLRKKQRPPRK